MALLLNVAPPVLALACWILAFLLFPPDKKRRWPILLLPMATLMFSSILAFSGAKIALDQVRFGDVDPTLAARILGEVLEQESLALFWSAAAFLGTSTIEALRVPAPVISHVSHRPRILSNRKFSSLKQRDAKIGSGPTANKKQPLMHQCGQVSVLGAGCILEIYELLRNKIE